MTLSKFKIIVNTIYRMSNLGDATISKVILDSLKIQFPNSEISIFCARPFSDKEFFSKFSNVNEDLYTVEGKNLPKFLIGINFLIKTISYLIWLKLRFFPIDSKAKYTFHLIQESDIVIFSGGGYLGGSQNPFPTILVLYFSKKLGKKVYLSGITIEPPKGFLSKHLIRCILNDIDLITVREPISLDVLNELKIKTKKFLTSDYALLLKSQTDIDKTKLLQKIGILKNSSIKIGISLMDPNTLRAHYNMEQIISYQNSIIKGINVILTNTTSEIYLFPFQKDEKVNDLLICNNVKKQIKSFSDRIHVIHDNYSPEQILTIIGIMDIFIGTRFHSIIFSLSNGIPTIAIGYHQKCRGFMKMMNLEKWLLDFSFKGEHLAEAVLELLNKKEKIAEKITNIIPSLRIDAQKNLDLIHELIEPKK